MLKIVKQFINSEVTLIALFLFLALLSIYWQSSFAVIIYLSLVTVCLFSVNPLNFIKSHIKRIFLFLFLGATVYLYFLQFINNIELWGDEIGVIKIAYLPFKYVVSQLSQQHIAVPPLDYWNMWLWKFIALLFPPSYAEIAYRIPFF